jgi:hypothetical protein
MMMKSANLSLALSNDAPTIDTIVNLILHGVKAEGHPKADASHKRAQHAPNPAGSASLKLDASDPLGPADRAPHLEREIRIGRV